MSRSHLTDTSFDSRNGGGAVRSKRREKSTAKRAI